MTFDREYYVMLYIRTAFVHCTLIIPVLHSSHVTEMARKLGELDRPFLYASLPHPPTSFFFLGQRSPALWWRHWLVGGDGDVILPPLAVIYGKMALTQSPWWARGVIARSCLFTKKGRGGMRDMERGRGQNKSTPRFWRNKWVNPKRIQPQETRIRWWGWAQGYRLRWEIWRQKCQGVIIMGP